MKGWQTSEVQVAAASVAWLGKCLADPHLYPSTHVACAIALALVSHSLLKRRTEVKMAEAGVPAPPSLVSHIWAWFRGRRASAVPPPNIPPPTKGCP